MTRAGDVQWSEMCFCNPPLAHERATVLDRYFDDIDTTPIEDYERYSGELFLERLQKLQENKR